MSYLKCCTNGDFLTTGLDSTCTSNIIKQYLQGTIPADKGNDDPDVVCDVDHGPFDLREYLDIR
jgi:hypothetical protein